MVFRKKNLKFDTVEKLHRELTNIVYLKREGDQSWYCFCDQRMSFCFIKRKCTLCSFCKILFKHDLIDNMSAREFLQRNMDDGKKPKQFFDLIWPFFLKMSLLNPQSLQFFNQEYHLS